MSNIAVAVGIQIFGITIASVSQLFLKNAADKKYNVWWHNFVNWRVVVSYGILLLSILCSAISMRILPLSMTPIWNAYSQVLVFVISIIVLKEKVTKRALLGFLLILVGIFVFFGI